MVINLHWDDIIYKIQSFGGISTYWKEITSRIAKNKKFNIYRSGGNEFFRYFPVPSCADIFHSSYYRTPLSIKTKNVVTVYDFIYELGFIKNLGFQLHIYQKKKAINTADAIICISENTKKDLLSFYPHLKENPHIYVIKCGTSFSIENTPKASKRIIEMSKVTKDRYILFVGTRMYYKNFESALIGFALSALPKIGYYMICTGSKFSISEEKLLNGLGLKNKVFVIEGANYEELNYLYQKAFALVYPSFYEGFGIPVIEAMSCGCPVIASQTSSLSEIAEGVGILIDPNDVKSITVALESLLDEKIRNDYISKGKARSKLFSWEKAAQQHIEVYEKVFCL